MENIFFLILPNDELRELIVYGEFKVPRNV